MNIGITLKENAYTPEAYAYESYLKLKGHQVQLDYTLDPNNDINIYFMGVYPFWKKRKGRAIEVHEYQSLSTPPYANFKNLTKRLINKRPNARIFLNEFVHLNLNFLDNIPFIYRDMGVDECLFQQPSQKPIYDILYCGSISGRVGLIEILLNFAKKFKVVVVGKLTEEERILLQVKNITLLGKVSRDELPEIYRNSRFGLNYTPDIYPYNIQTSTKTLEYLASGLGVISNRYKWSEDFFNKINYQPIWLNDYRSIEEVELNNNFFVSFPLMQEYTWNNILRNSNFEGFLREALYENI